MLNCFQCSPYSMPFINEISTRFNLNMVMTHCSWHLQKSSENIMHMSPELQSSEFWTQQSQSRFIIQRSRDRQSPLICSFSDTDSDAVTGQRLRHQLATGLVTVIQENGWVCVCIGGRVGLQDGGIRQHTDLGKDQRVYCTSERDPADSNQK